MRHKFRIWLPTWNSYRKSYYNSEATGIHTVGVLNNLYSNPNISQDTCVFEQWTGLTDKNGKEIYEGDIMEIPVNIAHQYEWEDRFIEQKCLVTFKNGVFAARWGHEGCNKEYPADGVVIGNIHENPELLGVTPKNPSVKFE